MSEIVILGAGLSGTLTALRLSKVASVTLINPITPENFKPISKLFPMHNYPYFSESEINVNDTVLFPEEHLVSWYMGTESTGIVDSKEFGGPMGKVVRYDQLVKSLLEKAEKQGVRLRYEKYPDKIVKNQEGVEFQSSDGSMQKAKLLILSGGGATLPIQMQSGLPIPDIYNGININLQGPLDVVKKNLPPQYIFHINPNISVVGPFAMITTKNLVSTGFLANKNESFQEMEEKLSRILKNYKKIQPLIEGLTPDEPAFPLTVSKHPIKRMVDDHIVVLGESAGLVSGFFYEGIIGALASSKFACEVIPDLITHNREFSKKNLFTYEDLVRKNLVNTYFETGRASEFLFYGSESNIKLLFNLYGDVLKSSSKARKMLYDACRNQQLEKYDYVADRWVGEQIFQKVPVLQKIVLMPHFLKAMNI